MPQALTIDDIWKLFEETNRLFKESDTRAEARRIESEARFQRDLEETKRSLRESRAEIERMHQETERMHQETERQFRETDKKIKETSTQIGRLGGRWGEFVEGLVAPACETMFMERGIPVHKVHPRTKATLPGNRRMEIDLLVINDIAIVAVEVKSNLKSEDVERHVERLGAFKEFYPEYAHKRLMGAVAGIVVEQGVADYAMKRGLFVIVQSGNNVHLINEPAFVPRIW
ncbi:MAG: DUF3782 domain-containing protein [Magnetococcales bacterium]|nr:DUF3782 domain-containing protein [Magnetococcales bacterium]